MTVVRSTARGALASILLVASAASVGCDVHSASRRSVYRDSQSVEVSGVTSLSLRVRVGSVHVLPADDTQPTVEDAQLVVELGVLLSDSRPETDAAKSIDAHLSIAQKDGVLEIVDRHRDAADAQDWELRLTLRVPPHLGMRIDQALGSVGVELGPKSSAEVTIELTTGAVDIVCPAEFRGAFDLAVDTGSLELRDEWAIPIERRLASSRAIGRVSDGGAPVRVRVGTGSVNVR